jgi:hypothetical protein
MCPEYRTTPAFAGSMGIPMAYGKWPIGLYRLDTGEFKESYDTDQEFAVAK